jgi:hypothetical protein
VVLLFVGTLAAEQHSTFAAAGPVGDPPFRVGSVTNGCVEMRAAVGPLTRTTRPVPPPSWVPFARPDDWKGKIPRHQDKNLGTTPPADRSALGSQSAQSARTIQNRELPRELFEQAENRH